MRPSYFLHAFGLLALLLSSYSSGAEPLHIFAGSSPIFAPVFVADQKGFFKAEGLDVTVRPFASGAEATEGFRFGAAEFLVAADVPLIYLLAGGDTVMLAQFSQNPDMLLMIGPTGMPDASALKGKRVGIASKSAAEYMLNNYLKRAGMSFSDIERVDLAPFDQVPALVRGDVYALSTWKPFDSKIAALSGNKYIAASYNSKENYIVFSGIVAKKDFLKHNPDAASRLLKALVKATDYIKQSDLKTVSSGLAQYLKSNANDIEHVIENNKWEMGVTNEFISTMASIEGFLADQKLISQRVDWKTAYGWDDLRRIDPGLAQPVDRK